MARPLWIVVLALTLTSCANPSIRDLEDSWALTYCKNLSDKSRLTCIVPKSVGRETVDKYAGQLQKLFEISVDVERNYKDLQKLTAEQQDKRVNLAAACTSFANGGITEKRFKELSDRILVEGKDIGGDDWNIAEFEIARNHIWWAVSDASASSLSDSS